MNQRLKPGHTWIDGDSLNLRASAQGNAGGQLPARPVQSEGFR